jgi:uncharacterized membrane protein YgaE (UPF0421/DUF939 family)
VEPRLEAALRRVRGRFDRHVLSRIAQAALAAGAAWEIALQIPNHGRPFFAPIAAVIGLGAQRGRRGRQALEMIVGVVCGILVGAGLVAVAGTGAWQLILATALTSVLATAGAAPPLIRVQAAASAILVVALHRPGTDVPFQRLVDALIGGGIAIVLARFLFPVDPLELVRDEARTLRERIADALGEVAAALEARDAGRARAALQMVDEIDDRALDDALALARDVVRKAPRRRALRRRLDALSAAWHELELTASDARAVATGTIRVLSEDTLSAEGLSAAVRAAADAVRTTKPAEARAAAERARSGAEAVDAGSSLGAAVVTHGVIAVAEHALEAADARDEERRISDDLAARGLRRRAVSIGSRYTFSRR